jgi:hypothetical protein
MWASMDSTVTWETERNSNMTWGRERGMGNVIPDQPKLYINIK